MNIDCLPFKQTGYFSELITDYLDESAQLKPFYHRFPKLENFKGQIEEKAKQFPQENRQVLHDVLQEQYAKLKASKKTQIHINQLKEKNTFTVVTGHQLNLFTGPLYFLYKIISTINLTKQLKSAYSEYNFVPVYWMATEDHDFDEINYFNFKGQKVSWNIDAAGAVGRLSTEGLDAIFKTFSSQLGSSENAETLKNLFQKAYLEHETLTDATRYLANELFKNEGLVIIDGDSRQLKEKLVPYIKKDIFDGLSFEKVNETALALKKASKNYTVQVNPREINYFYIKEGLRERIIETDTRYAVNNTDITFSKDELLSELKSNPECFSPNVIARPLYQEVILPNLCYIGGGGEMAYWLELKSMFKSMQITFPILLVRNSVLLVSQNQAKKVEKIGVSIADLFLKQNTLINKRIREISNIDIDFSPQKVALEEQFKSLHEMATKTDESFLGAVKAQEVKQKKGLDHLEKRLLKAQKRKLKDEVMRLAELQNQLFPDQTLQERKQNFSNFYLEYGDTLIPDLLKALEPLKLEFTVLVK